MMLHSYFFSFKLVLFILFSLNIAFSYGGKETGKPHFHTIRIDPLVPKPTCSASKSGLKSHRLKLLHRYGPCSPFHNLVKIPTSNEILRKNEVRVQWLNSRISNSYTTMSESGKSYKSGPSLGDGAQYVTTIGIGTPKVDYTVMIDTGSDYTWIRCKPCLIGCNSKSPLFDPFKSSTYRNVSGEFSMQYGDKSTTWGFWGSDTLTLEPSDVIYNFRFGCGQQNIDPSHDDFAHAAGILGLGRGALSLVSQSAAKFGKIFAYCLPKSRQSQGYLVFGDEARRISSSSTLQFTELLTSPPVTVSSQKYIRDSLYFVQLVGISVAGTRLNLSSQVFTSVGTIIDSGTVVTHLPSQAYRALSSTFNQSMSAYPPAPPQDDMMMDTCYSVKIGQGISFPSITFHFAGGTDVVLDESGIGWTATTKKVWCLGFAPNKNDDDLTIIGNTQQREMEVLYNVEAGKIGFGKKHCGN